MAHRVSKPSFHILFIAVLAISAGIVGCTFKHIQPEIFTAPTQKYSVVAMGNITSDDKLWENLVAHFRRGFVDKLSESKTFDTILDPAPTTLAALSIILSGRITEVHKGSEALRWIIGFGAGRSRVSGTFTITSDRGETLAKFDAQETYSGGLGIGGAGFLDMEDLMQRFGKTIAVRVVQWSRGEKTD
jgi:hypothetical protein